MPNHVKNIVTASNHVLKALVNDNVNHDGSQDEQEVIDFNLVIPQPAVLKQFGGGIPCLSDTLIKDFCQYVTSTHVGMTIKINQSYFAKQNDNYFKYKNGNKIALDTVQTIVNDFAKTQDEKVQRDIPALSLQMQALAETGYLSPLDWSRANWNTKWNAYYASIDLDNDTISFDTAWNTPFNVMVELSKKFPSEQIEVQYADEDLGANCGIYVLKDGEVVEELSDNSEMDKEDKGIAYWQNWACNLCYGADYTEIYPPEEAEA